MRHAKKNTARAGEVPKEGKGHTKGHGKVIPFGPKAGQRRKEEQGKEGVREKKIFDQIEIPFTAIITDGVDG
jgi:hypothetical protein